MKSKIVLVLLLFIIPNIIFGQTSIQDEKILRSIADNILSSATYDFYDPVSDKILQKVDEANYSPRIRIRCRHNSWNYWNGILNIAMFRLTDYFNDKAYGEFAARNYEFAFDNVAIFRKNHTEAYNKWVYPFGQLIVTKELDDCGSMGAGLIEAYKLNNRIEYRTYLDKAANHILYGQDRLDDGTLVRAKPSEMTLWADDLYMSVSFLARMGDLTKDTKYFDDAAKQVINFTKYLYNSHNQLYYHCWYSDLEQNGVAHWGRANGWVIFAQVSLLEFLPEDHPQRDTLISILEQQILGVSRYQSQSGLWHQLIDKTDSYLETSATSMITYSIAKAVNSGWIDSRYASIANLGWSGLKTKVQADGEVQGICVGTIIKNDLSYYYNRPTKLSDKQGLGAILLAGLEVLKMNLENKEE